MQTINAFFNNVQSVMSSELVMMPMIVIFACMLLALFLASRTGKGMSQLITLGCVAGAIYFIFGSIA